MKKVKCDACGAAVVLENGRGKCAYCGTICVDSAPKEEPKTTTTTTVINNYYGEYRGDERSQYESEEPQVQVQVQNNTYAPNVSEMSESELRLYYAPRPKIHWFPTLLGFCFYIFPGVLYVAYKAYRQRKWDELHGLV